MGAEKPDRAVVTIYTCAECPVCEAGASDDVFYCKHGRRDRHDPETAEPVGVYDPPPSWCPIRVERMLIVVHGSEDAR